MPRWDVLSIVASPDRDSDVIVVGGGFSGLVIGELLSTAGLRCRVLEAGPALRSTRGMLEAASTLRHPDPARWASHLEGVSELAASLPGARTRIRAVGGRSLVWGGWCERFDESSLRDGKQVGRPWPVSLDALAPYYRRVERLLSVRTQRGGLGGLAAKTGLHVRAPRIARDGQRVRTALSFQHARRCVVADAIVRRILFSESRVAGVEYWDRAGQLVHANAPLVVLCASPEETVRILLTEAPASLADRVHLIGRGVVDHLMVAYLAAAPMPAKQGAHRGGGSTGALGFVGGTSAFIPRFVNMSRATRRDYLGGFSLEVHGPISATRISPDWLPLLRIDPKSAREVSAFIVTAMGDALPDERRFVSLHPSTRDALGRPVPITHQHTSDNDRRMIADMKETALAVVDAITPPGTLIVPFRDPLRHRALFHEAGGCGMGTDPKNSVTDAMGRVRGTRGLYISDTSIFPTGGDRHPTLTLLALAARIADGIVDAAKVGF